MNWKRVLPIISILVDVCLGLQISMGGSKTVANIDIDEATVVLNCTYVEDLGDEVHSGRSITWRRGDGGSSYNVAGFSKPGGENPTYYPNGEYLRNRSQLYAPTDDSKSAVIVIQEVLCEDDRNEFYCTISFDNSGPQTEISDTVKISLQKSVQQPLNYPLISTTQTQEGNAIYLACTADVGKPPGYVTWWRFRTDHSIAQISQSDFIDDEAGICEFVSGVNTTYTVTREDNGAFFRCTSGRNVTDESGPEADNLYRDTETINVHYEAMVTGIARVPEMDIYPISTSQLNLTCLADGNPVPNQNDYKWTFQGVDSNATAEDMNSASNSLILYILQESQSGTYTCTVSNQLNSTHSSNITIIVNGTIPDPPLSLHCHSSPCSAMERCIDWGQGYTCETNEMAAAGVAFIVITIAFLSVIVGLVYYTRKMRMKVDIHKGTECDGKNTAVSKSEAGDMKAHNGDRETHTGDKEAHTGDKEAHAGDTEPNKSPSGSGVIYAKIKK